MRAHRFLALVLPCALCVSLVAEAQQKGAAPPERSVALLVQPAKKDAGQVGELVRLIEAALADRGIPRRRLLASFDTAGLVVGREKLEEARRRLLSDHRLQHAVEIEGLLTQALLGFKGALGAVERKELVEVMSGLSLTRLEQGDRRLAQSYLTAAYLLDASLTESDFAAHTAQRDLFREVGAGFAALKRCRVRVESRPPGAEVYVGDELRGYTPLELGDIREGTQLIRVRADGFYSHGWLADVLAKGSARLHHDLRPLAGRKQAEQWIGVLASDGAWKTGAGIQEAADGLRRLFGATDLVVGTVERTKQGYEVSGAVAPAGKPATRLEAVVPIDATLLKRVRVLGYEWLP